MLPPYTNTLRMNEKKYLEFWISKIKMLRQCILPKHTLFSVLKVLEIAQ